MTLPSSAAQTTPPPPPWDPLAAVVDCAKSVRSTELPCDTIREAHYVRVLNAVLGSKRDWWRKLLLLATDTDGCVAATATTAAEAATTGPERNTHATITATSTSANDTAPHPTVAPTVADRWRAEAESALVDMSLAYELSFRYSSPKPDSGAPLNVVQATLCWDGRRCDRCLNTEFGGVRFICPQCPDYDLCVMCFFKRRLGKDPDAHDMTHEIGPLYQRREFPEAEADAREAARAAAAYLVEELRDIAEHGMLRYRTARSAKDEEEKVAWPTASLGVMVSDNAVNEALRCKIVELAEPLVAESLRTERWHPGSDRKVLDLIHPSNYPLCFGKTMYSQKPGAIIGEEVVMALGATETIEPDVSGKFQWLPSEFRVDAEGSVTVESYVNNLDGKAHAALVQTIAETFECLLPMLECSLGASVPTDDDRRVAASLCESDFTSEDQRHQSEEFMRKHRCLSSRYPYVTPELIAEHENDEDVQRAASESTFVSMADLHRYQHLYCEVRVPRFPPHCPASPIRLLQQSLKNKTLQVIVKMAEIRLTPEQPRYAGGKWHLEGMYNEAITATALVYYNLDNIADSRVKFRHVYSEPKFDYPQDQYFGLEKVYGFKAGSWQDDRLRESGHVSALQGRSVVFRNFHQHRVEPFELADKTRAGRRGVMAFFVVDPAVRLPSTRNVPCQQREAVVRELGSAFGGRLPVDVVRNVVKAAGCTMSEQEAGRVAEMVMEERSSGIVGGFANVYGITLCEH